MHRLLYHSYETYIMIQLISYNILEGIERKEDLIQQFIEQHQPDILVLNEANMRQEWRYHFLCQHYPYMMWHHYGQGWANAVFSRFPICRYRFGLIHRQGDQNRGYLCATLQCDNHRMDVLTYHPHPWRRPHKRLEDYYDLLSLGQSHHQILVGDSNALHDPTMSEDALIRAFASFMPHERAQQAVPLFFESGRLLTAYLEEEGWTDVLRQAGHSIPTKLINPTSDSNMRIDIAYTKNIITKGIIIRDPLTERISDHYPVQLFFTL